MTLEFDKNHTKNKTKKNTKNITKVFHTLKQQITRIKNLGIKKYTEKLIDEAPTEKSLKWMGSDDKKTLPIKFNTAYYLAKNERPLTVFVILLNCTRKAEWETLGRFILLTRNVLNILNTLSMLSEKN